MGNLMSKRNWFFGLSALIIIPGVISLCLFHLKLSVDFTGGALIQYTVPQNTEPGQIEQVFAQSGVPDVQVQTTTPSGDTRTAIVRTPPLDVTKLSDIDQALKQKIGKVTRDSADTVGPVIGGQTSRAAFVAVGAASGFILLYIWWAFRRLENAWRYGVCAIIALLHDVLVVVGLWSILGEVFGLEVDTLFVTGVLTVVGFSVHDTVVVFDRIRENLVKRTGVDFETTVNNSLVQTLVRSLNTSLTVLFTLLALTLFGGVTIRNFTLVLLIGIASGTYSSIFNASALLVVWENGDIARLFRRGKPAGRRLATAR